MIDGLAAVWVSDSETIKEIELYDPSAPDEESSLNLTAILVIGPPDPNALSYLVPRAVFERGHPVHVGALAGTADVEAAMLEILEVMDTRDIVVFLCEDQATLNAAIELLEPTASD